MHEYRLKKMHQTQREILYTLQNKMHWLNRQKRRGEQRKKSASHISTRLRISLKSYNAKC